MSEVREIVTRAVLAKGRKIFRIHDIVSPGKDAYSILGCWVINHEFDAALSEKTVTINGQFEINIWYAYDNNTKTDVSRSTAQYTGTIRVRDVISDSLSDDNDVTARVLQQPTCVNVKIVDEGIDVEVIFEILAEVIGETKMLVTVFNYNNTFESCDDDFEGDINEDFIEEDET